MLKKILIRTCEPYIKCYETLPLNIQYKSDIDNFRNLTVHRVERIFKTPDFTVDSEYPLNILSSDHRLLCMDLFLAFYFKHTQNH